MNVDGKCHCGYIRYKANVNPEKVFICHCTDCQTLSGTAFRTVVPVPESDFELLAGKLKVYIKAAESGNKREQTFCPECGSPIYATSVGGESRMLGVRVGSMVQRDQLPPTALYWARSAHPWIFSLEELPRTDMQK